MKGHLHIHGNYLSQPARAVLWAATMKRLPFTFHKVNPVMGEAETPEYLAKFPSGYIPAIEIVEEGKAPIRMTESGAILPFLAETHGWEDLYPSSPSAALQRARINQWLHWSHGNLRFATTNIFRPHMLKIMREAGTKPVLFNDEASAAAAKRKSVTDKLWKDAMLTMTHGALKDSPFLASTEGPTVADLALYCEIDQIHYAGLYDFAAWPEVHAWIERMQRVPEHDNVRRTLFKFVKGNSESFLVELVGEMGFQAGLEAIAHSVLP